jgi:lipopolysaccharide transport system permease protein
MPLASVLSGFVDFSIAFVMLIGMAAYYGRLPGVNILWVPALLLLGFATALGVSLWLSALNVEYRDVRHTIPFIVQVWMFATPIAYPTSLVPVKWRALYGINPMVGVVEGFRWALLGTNTRPGPVVLVSIVGSLLILISGAMYFRRMEKTFADVV